MFELTDRYVILEVYGKVIAHLFAGQESQEETRWQLAGQVVGETPGVGCWLRMDGMVAPHGEERWIPSEVLYLIRWNWVLNATIFPEKPKSLKDVGFRMKM
jgi:hypothetical protein